MIEIQLPISAPTIRDLHVGDQVRISGLMHACRLTVLQLVREGQELPFTSGSIVYHAGPVGKKRGKRWSVESLAPDHSPPAEDFLRELCVRYGVRGLIGRGELSKSAIETCRQYGICYFGTISGAGPLLARHVEEVQAVHLTDQFESRDALWDLAVKDFPATCMIDAHGQSLHDIVRDLSNRRLLNLQL